MRRGFLVLAIFGWLLGGGNSAIAETSYKIADYFPLQKGNGWFFDRNAFVVSNLEYTFSEY